MELVPAPEILHLTLQAKHRTVQWSLNVLNVHETKAVSFINYVFFFPFSFNHSLTTTAAVKDRLVTGSWKYFMLFDRWQNSVNVKFMCH